MRIERYFFTLLRNTNLTLQEILDNTFEPHEIDILEPASHPPELVKLQKANSIRYQQILDTRFKGNVPTLQLKLTFLYFGLPIAPMKPGASQTLVITDLDFLEDKVQIATDPLGFLNEYAERAYGDPHKHVPDRHFLQLPPTQEFTSLRIRPQPYDDLSALRLRGGALPLKMDWEPESDDTSEPPTISIRIFGYQGSILVQLHSSAYESFVEAVDQLLGMRYKYNYSIRLQIWVQNGSDTEPVAQATGMIYQKNKRPSGVDDIYSLVEKLFSRDNEDGKYCGFVCFDKEESPESYKPSYEADRQIIRVWDNDKKNMAYMKIPKSLLSIHKQNQFSYEYLRAMRVLFPKSPHTYFRFSASVEEITYGLLDPPRVVWDKVIQDHTTEDGLPLLSFGRIAVPDDAVPVFVPGFHSYDTDFSGGFPVTSLSRDDLKLDGGDDEKAGLSKLISAVNAANPFAISNKKKIGIEIWIPGDEFSNSSISGQFINLVGTEINEQTIYNWKTAVRRYQRPRIHAEPGKISIAARPVFSTYTISAKNDPKRQFSIDLNDIKLSEFKEEVKSKLFPRYQLTSKNLALHLVQSTWSTNRIDFAVTVDTDENGWRWIVRHITEPDITISLEYWVSSWAIEKGSTWGPRYDTTEPFTLTSQFDSTNKDFAPYDPPVRRLFEESKNNLDGAVRAQKLRERLFWDSTSMFASPTKPALPLQGPPIETLIRTGPNVPAFTTAMRTPSEVARLEREVHTLRGNILDRVRECPYKDCGQIFRFQDGSKLDRHLREDHTTLQCFLCDKEKHLLRFYDTQSIRQHFLDKHYNSIKEELLGVSGDQEHGTGEPKYCNRCGRDQTVLNNPTDKAYHNSVCRVGPRSHAVFCGFCGRTKENASETCECAKFTNEESTEDDIVNCITCGIEYDSTMSRSYRDQHRYHCRLPGGRPNDCCPGCGIGLADKNEGEKSSHMSTCTGSSPPHNKPTDPSGHEVPPNPPVPSKFTDILKPPRNDTNIVPPPKIETKKSISSEVESLKQNIPPHHQDQQDPVDLVDPAPSETIEDLLNVLGQDEPSIESSIESSIEPEPAEPPLPWREATTSDPLPSRRSSSPPWDEFLEPQSEPWAFYPEADWRCSRCFRAAGKSMDHIEMHMYEKGSCRIRRTLGTTTYGPVPNRSGWILPDEKFDFRAAYYKFVSEYPAYQHTMFPVRKESIKSVWEDPYTLKNATGSIEDDPNYTRLKYTETPGDELPWPPYKGLAIPLNGPGPEPDSPKVKIFVPVDKEESEKVNKDDSKSIEELDEELDEEQEKLADPEELDSNSKVTIPPEDNILASTEEDDSSLVASSSEFEESDESEQSAEIDEDYDPTKQPAETGDELEEEYSERSAVEDPIQELETVPPEKSKKRATPITPPFDAEDRTSWPSVKKRVVPPPPEVKAEPIPINLDPPSPHGIDYVPWITPQPIKSPRSEKKRIQLPEWDPVISVPPIWDEMNELARKFGRGSQPPLMKPFISSEPHFKRSASGPPSARPQTRGKDSFGKGRK